LDLSRIEAGRIALAVETVDVLGLIEEVAAMLQPAAIEAGVTLHVARPTSAISIEADRRRLQQVLINLVSNAVKYNQRAGQVDIGARVVERTVHLTVSDTGAGIPERYLNELFEPFNRLGQEHSGVVGSGVGLAICKRLVEAMHGSIRANSTEGVGSTFTIT